MSPSNRSLTMLKRLFFILITLGFVFAVIETISRVAFHLRYDKYDTTPFIQGNSLKMADSTLVFRNRPFYLDEHLEYQNNEEGFKSAAGDVRMPEKKAGEFWVFLFGASAMEGMGSNKDGAWLDITGVRDHPYQESIAYLLQQELEARLPGHKVRVFSAANSGFTALQSQLQYHRLRDKYKIDWVISMDGVNEHLINDTTTSMLGLIRTDWAAYPLFHPPLTYIIPFTSRITFINRLKRALFEARLSARLAHARDDGFPARRYWLQQHDVSLATDSGSSVAKRTADSLFHCLDKFDQALTLDQVPHILFLQPHLIMQDTSLMSDTEKALYHYYLHSRNDKVFNGFLYNARVAVQHAANPNIRVLNPIHGEHEEVFVDYCHFTSGMNARLASLFADSICARSFSQASKSMVK